MTKYITTALFAFMSATSVNCAPKQATCPVPVAPDCSSLDLQDKVGFSIKIGSKDKEVCYKIQSVADQSFEYAGLCKPVEGTLEFYRTFTGLNKGGMEINYITNFMGVPAYVSFSRSPSGEITTPPELDLSKEEVEKEFQKGIKVLDSIKNLPEVCEKLYEYKKDKAAKH